MKRSVDKALEQAAQLYVKASAAKVQKDKNLARIRLQQEALIYAANVMEEWTKLMLDGGERHRECKAGIEQLRELVIYAKQVLTDMEFL